MPETMFTLRNRHNLDLELGQELDDSDYNDNSSENIYSGDEFNTDSQELDDSDYNDNSLENIYGRDKFNTDIKSNLDSECESILDNLPKVFNGTRFDLNWDEECSYGPFKNFTNMAIFVWVTKYMISTAAYQVLIQILLHPKFEKSHLTPNLQDLKRQREQLPLMKIQSHMVPINIRNILSTIKDSTRVYFFSLIEHLQ
ncbi:Serine/threonine protein kinase [Gigaspora margarita]|uniref:Serine/threonine protein kinase n=1 Tax=Gigaspora margarita TaxID=4874 RepID=A0A8H4B0I6_GIGMA|nr:Serine/threonine protein kinase [Gigaspora margarita]KAF0550436.1 Serine/threonine protein kinase [Gigaspora margarita]